jgi:hypothetical protein
MAVLVSNRDSDNPKSLEEIEKKLFQIQRHVFYRELARLIRMRTDRALPDLIEVLEATEKYPSHVLLSLAKKLREGEASFSSAIREWAPVRDSVILNLVDKRSCPLEAALDFLVEFPE